MPDFDVTAALIPFGFTRLESEIYAFLLGEATATGYRIAQAIGKPVANTYKAIQTLQSKGAIVVEEGGTRLCRAVPSEELIARVSREFDAHRALAKAALGRISPSEEDDRIYQLRSKIQVMQRARQMLSDAKKVALIAASADIVRALADDLTEAAGRSVEVFVKTTEDIPLTRVESFVTGREGDLLRSGHFLRLVVDGEQHLAGVFGPGGDEAQFVWSRNPAFSLLQHEGVAAEIAVLSVAERLEDGAGPKRLARALAQTPHAAETLGGKKLFALEN